MDKSNDGLTLKEVLKTRAFYCLAFNMSIALIPAELVIAYYKVHLNKKLFVDKVYIIYSFVCVILVNNFLI